MNDAVSIAVFGTINVGKSSLINALAAREVCSASAVGGSTSVVSVAYELPDLNLRIVDTPGIAEAGGEARRALSLEAARQANLVLFVIAGDMTAHEVLVLHALYKLDKPLLVVLNQIDRYNKTQLDEILRSVHSKIGRGIGTENIILVAAAPHQKIIVVDKHGQEAVEERAGLPDVTALRQRINAVLAAETQHLLGLPEIISKLESAQKQALESQNSAKQQIEKKADEVINNFAVGTALTVAINPIPLLDLAVGAGGLAILVSQLADAYRMPMGESEVQKITGVLASASKDILAGSSVAYIGGSLLKFIPFIGTVAGGLVQAGAVGYAMTILGEATKTYFANGKSWGEGGFQKTLEDIVKHIDKASVSGRVVERVKQRLGAS